MVTVQSDARAKAAKTETRSPSWNLVTSRVLNLLLYLNFCLLTGSGLLLWLRELPRQGPGPLNISRHGWGEVHSWASAVFIGLIVAHLVMHRKWLRTVVSKQHPILLWGGLATGIVVVLVLLFVPVG
jgi:cytochrome b561